MKHIVAYEGTHVALGLMQEAYIPLFLPWVNWRIGVEGTLQRPPYSLAQGIEWVQSLNKTKGVNEVFAILSKKTLRGKPSYEYIGHTGIHHVEWPNGSASTGSLIGANDGRGKGFGTEAKLLLLYHAFMILGLRKITSNIKEFNAQSGGHLMKCGYKMVGRYRAHDFHEGEFVDQIMFEVFREDWQPIWDKYKKSKTLPSLTTSQRALLKKETRT